MTDGFCLNSTNRSKFVGNSFSECYSAIRALGSWDGIGECEILLVTGNVFRDCGTSSLGAIDLYPYGSEATIVGNQILDNNGPSIRVATGSLTPVGEMTPKKIVITGNYMRRFVLDNTLSLTWWGEYWLDFSGNLCTSVELTEVTREDYNYIFFNGNIVLQDFTATGVRKMVVEGGRCREVSLTDCEEVTFRDTNTDNVAVSGGSDITLEKCYSAEDWEFDSVTGIRILGNRVGRWSAALEFTACTGIICMDNDFRAVTDGITINFIGSANEVTQIARNSALTTTDVASDVASMELLTPLTADWTITNPEVETILTNVGATATRSFYLPQPDVDLVGVTIRVVAHEYSINIYPRSQDIIIGWSRGDPANIAAGGGATFVLVENSQRTSYPYLTWVILSSHGTVS